jgi:hypothetical protein
MAETLTVEEASAERRVAGTVGVALAVGLAVILGIHPPSDTALYDDGVEYVEHVSGYWVTIHLVAALLLVAVPAVVVAWGGTLRKPAARVFGRLTGWVAVMGVSIGVIHLVGTDTVTFEFFGDTLESGAPGAETVADGFVRLHAATLTSWIVVFWLGLPLSATVASWLDGRRTWHVWVPGAAVALSAASLAVTMAERQYTTLSEMGLFRPAAVLLLVWLFLIGRELRTA